MLMVFFTINNITLIDEDGLADTGGDLKSGAQGTINGASWRGYTDNVKIRASFQNNCADDKKDSYTNYKDDLLNITNSEWVGTASMADWTTVYTGSVDEAGADCVVPADYNTAIETLLEGAGNSIHGSPTLGADATPFAGWSWSAANNKL